MAQIPMHLSIIYFDLQCTLISFSSFYLDCLNIILTALNLPYFEFIEYFDHFDHHNYSDILHESLILQG